MRHRRQIIVLTIGKQKFIISTNPENKPEKNKGLLVEYFWKKGESEKSFTDLLQEEAEEGEEQLDSGTIVKVGDGNDNTMIVNTATSVQSQDTTIVNSEAGTLLESDLGTMVINSDDDEDATMKSKLSTFVIVLLTLN